MTSPRATGDVPAGRLVARTIEVVAPGPLMDLLPANQRYSYIFDGNSQVLDHILVSPAIKGYSYGVVHINAEFSDQASDHDPQIMRIAINCEIKSDPARCQPKNLVVDG